MAENGIETTATATTATATTAAKRNANQEDALRRRRIGATGLAVHRPL